jgi:hypothetical protein
LEMDDRAKAFNILATLTRREEGYHQKLMESREEVSGEKIRTIHEIFDSKERDLDQYLHFDRYRRASFLDHFIPESTDFDSFRGGRYQEEGDFIGGLYELGVDNVEKNREVLFSRSGTIGKEGEKAPARVEKRFVLSLNRSALKAAYRITYGGNERKRTNFGIEFNINLLAGDAPDRYYDVPGHALDDRKLASIGEFADVSEVFLIDEWNGMVVALRANKKCNVARFPIETVSLSENGFEKVFQGSCLLFYWPLEFERGGQFEVDLELEIHPNHLARKPAS